METRTGLFTKLGLYSCAAITLFIVGKRHIASHKDTRHRTETDALVDSDENEFATIRRRPGLPESRSDLEYGSGNSKSKYIGKGSAYASRTPGDRLTMFSIFDKNDYGKDK